MLTLKNVPNNTVPTPRRLPLLYFLFLVSVLSVWTYYVLSLPNLDFIKQRWAAMLTMLFGSFIAGASPEGSAAIAYPVFTLLLEISPAVARNFGFAIQSIGMTSASLLILGLRVKVEWRYILFVTIGGIFGLVFGTYYVVPLISPVLAKLFFVSLWLSFGIALWLENRRPHREVFEEIQHFGQLDKVRLIAFGIIGGIISSIFGTGINIFTFCLMTIYYRVSEKVATPSSVIIMTIETILGFFLHAQILQDFSDESFKLWLACIPVVVFFAPLGAFVITKLPREGIAKILYTILVVQFVGAMFVIKPNFNQALLCATTLAIGLGLFTYLGKLKRDF
ncbi:MAG: sulfite exporter TauE/SafE family protein [Runella slithyformis]|nr:MAG: sulfite exporter TauE/SafE family protein [Runella slithyformis]TAF46455.1 MAG: sulfite exporter TauE/SafE family protein [Runella slithyformis]TAF82600.1 MAG: sulfite exporter TauE/SafE family protein [Runella slithyformis]TAH14921.1 MAG: sulfite exporter TauE/SafE family protein [Runella slithyformis]